MLGKELVKHLREFRRNVAAHKYEVSPEGIYMPEAHVFIRGVYSTQVNDEPWQHDHNIIPDEGLNHILGAIMVAASQITTWYMALYANAYTPTSTLTAGLFPATAGEITSGSEGYSPGTRVIWVGDAVDTGNSEVMNNTTPAAFTIVTGSSLAVNGAALLSVNTKGSTSGTMISAGRFSAQRNLSNTDTFNVKYKIDADAV